MTEFAPMEMTPDEEFDPALDAADFLMFEVRPLYLRGELDSTNLLKDFHSYLYAHQDLFFNIEDLVYAAMRLDHPRLARDLAPHTATIMREEMKFSVGWEKEELELRIEDVETVGEQLRLRFN